MYRYLTINPTTTQTLAGLIIGMLLVQILTPTIALGMNELASETQKQTTDEPLFIEPEPPVENASGAASDTSQATTVIVAGESEAVDDHEGAAPEASTLSGTSSIDTGDATASLAIDNEINFNEINTNATSSTGTEENIIGDTTTLPNNTSEVPIIETDENLSTLTTQATNTATTSTSATTTATTGDNTAIGNVVTINTGDAIAYTDVLNVVNTDIIDSTGLVKFINETLGYQDFDLRDEFNLAYAQFETSQSTPSCTLETCADANTTISTNNSAYIENNILVSASTGGNEAIGNNTSIQTGDAFASANIINVANTNITDSNYLLLVFNNFSDYAGDIVLPNSAFFDNLLQNSSGVSDAELSLNNDATLNNSVETIANTGNNSASGDSTNITTGDAGANSNVTNVVNQNIIGGSSFSILIRVQGDWTGSITGLPDGLTWRETDQGIEIISIDGTGSGSVTSNLVQSTSNTATINNNVQVFALTGDNQATGDDGTISTGSAYADSSVLNIANTNVIGSNWANLIFTIYGNWNGNLTFGQPNLWLGVTADSSDSPMMPGSSVTYTYTVFNRGDSTAPDVTLDSIFEGNVLSFADTGNQTSLGANTQNSWSLGDIGAGETREFTRTATVLDTLDRRTVSAIPLTSRVLSTQKDADVSDNEDVVTISVGEKRSSSNSKRNTFPAHFDITKTASRDLAQPGDVIDYTVTFFNRGGQLYDALLVDILENEKGEIIQKQSWPFAEIKNWETITVTYSIGFDSAITAGIYTNYAQLVGFHKSQSKKYQAPYESPIASHTLSLGLIPAGQVLGISDSICRPYLTEYLRYNANNSPLEVSKLQQFLNDHLNLNLAVLGFFDQATEQGVRDFQNRYRDEILTPWGLTRDSGFVYYTTQKKINEIMCGGTAVFPLASTQLNEMASFKNKMQFSFTTENTNQKPINPATGSIILTPTPMVRQLEKSPAVQTIDTLSTPQLHVLPTPQNAWSSVRGWWQSLTRGLRTSFR